MVDALNPAVAYLDTNVVVWLAQGNLMRVTPPAMAVMEQASLLVSPMVLLELEYLYEIRRTLLSARDVLRKVEYELGVRVCDLSFPRVTQAALDEHWTRDPFDRMIVAQAKANGLAALLSADEEIAAHYAKTVW